jgi:hypothetical protein
MPEPNITFALQLAISITKQTAAIENTFALLQGMQVFCDVTLRLARSLDVSKDHSAFIFEDQAFRGQLTGLTF